MRLSPLLLPVLFCAGEAAAHAPLVLRADEVHLGDGRVIAPGVVIVRGERIEAIGAEGRVAIPADAVARRVHAVLPGLVASLAPPNALDPDSVGPDRRALDLVDRHADRSNWLEAGITAVAISPGRERLVPGRGGLLRLSQAFGQRAHLVDGPLHAVLRPSALSPPPRFEPNTPVNVDSPLSLAESQRPESPSAAVGTLRGLLQQGGRESSGAFADVIRGRTSFAVHAETQPEIRSALELAAGTRLRLLIVGGTEAWKLADELAAAGASVLLTGANAGQGAAPADSGDWRPDVAARLAAAGVRVALGVDADSRHPAPLLAAAAAVRAGLPRDLAIAAVTGRAAEAAGSPELGLLRSGGPADLVAFDAAPLALSARPVLVMVAGRVRHELLEDEPPELLVLRAGLLRTAELDRPDVALVLGGGRVRGIEPGSTATAAGADLRDFGRRAVIVPGLLDAFAWIGLEPGPPASGGSRVHASRAIETDDPSLGRALAAGLTSVVAAPWTGGPLRGRPELIATSLLPVDSEAGRNHEELELLGEGPAPFLFALDEGPADEGARSGRLKALQGLLRKAKGYHEQWVAFEKKDDGKPPASKATKERSEKTAVKLSDSRNRPGRPEEAESSQAKRGKKPQQDEKKAPEKDAELEPFRDLFRGKTRAWLRAGRQDSIVEGLKAFQSVGLVPVLVGGEEADLVAEQLAKAKAVVVLEPTLTRRHEGETILVASALRSAGVGVAFGSMGFGNSDRLPLQAAAAVRAGLAPSEALRALTLGAAEVVGAASGLGRLGVGDRADCVVFSGDPLEPASRVLAVVVRGRIVHEWGDDLSGLGQ